MENLKKDELEIKLENSNDHVKMIWLGKSTAREPSEFLNPYLESVIKEMSAKDCEIDFSKLNLMNSSTVTSIVKLVNNLNSENIKTVVLYKGDIEWQKASFKALETITMTMDHITVKAL